MEDELCLLVSAPSHVLEQISLDNFILFGKMLELQMSEFLFSHQGGPWVYNRERNRPNSIRYFLNTHHV